MIILHDVYEKISKSFADAESGGIIGGKANLIIKFHYDNFGICKQKEYIPNIDCLNTKIREWNLNNIVFIGLIHSHKKNKELSKNDIQYAKSILLSGARDKMFSTIVMGVYVCDTKKLWLYRVLRICEKVFVIKLVYVIL